MSNLLVQNIKHTNNTTSMSINSSGQVSVRGESSATTTNLQQGLAKIWVNFVGAGTASVQDSFNNASITDQGTGQYQFAYTNSPASINIAWTSSTGNENSSNAGIDRNSQMGGGNTSNFHYELFDITGNANADAVTGYFVGHGDLA